jgi:hypothetical protein
MLAYIIADLIAARALEGYTTPNARIFCDKCDVWNDPTLGKKTHVWKRLRARFDYDQWTSYDVADTKAYATAYLHARPEDRKKLYTTNGWRWVPFWDLPYFNPHKQVATEPAHAVGINGVSWLCRIGLKLSDNDAKHKAHVGEAFELAQFPEPVDPSRDWAKYGTNELKRIRNLLVEPITIELSEEPGQDVEEDDDNDDNYDEPIGPSESDFSRKHLTPESLTSRLMGFHLPSLRHVHSILLNDEPKAKKAGYAAAIVDWVSTMLYGHENNAQMSLAHGSTPPQ